MKQRLCAVLGVLALAACGSDSAPTGNALCTKAGTVGAAVTTKLAACVPNAGASIGGGSTCATSLNSCTAADQTALNSILDCLNTAASGAALTSSQCSSATLTTLTAQLNACTDSSHLAAVSSACKAAFGFESSGTLGSGSCTYTASSTGGGACVQLVGANLTECSAFNVVPTVTFTFSSSACATTVGGQPKLGTCTISSGGASAKLAIYGTNVTDAATQCTSQGGTWAAGS